MFIAPPLPTSVLSQIEIVDDFLEKMGDLLPGALVAGGAPRSWFFLERAKDIDIFIDPSETTLEQIADEFIKRFGGRREYCTIRRTEELSPNYRSENISAVLTLKYRREKVQIIEKRIKDSNPLATFPCTLSLITYEKFTIVPTTSFMESVRYGFNNFLSNTNAPYMKKMMTYFPDFRSNVINRTSFAISQLRTALTIREQRVGQERLTEQVQNEVFVNLFND